MKSSHTLRMEVLFGLAATSMVCAFALGCGQSVVTAKVDPTKRKVTIGVGVSAGQNSSGTGSAADSTTTATESVDATGVKPTDVVAADVTGSGSANKSVAAEPSSTSRTGQSTDPTVAKSTVAEFSPPPPRKFKVEGPNGALRINYDDLDVKKLLNLDNVFPGTAEKLPEWVKVLNGKTVRLRGYMKPGFQADDISQFVFARDTGACCFGPNLRFDYLITVTMAEDKTTSLRELRPFDVVGKFRIELAQLDDGTIYGLYHIDDATLLDK